MSGYRCFMRSVKLNFLLIFLLIFGLSYQGSADCPWNAKSNTEVSSTFGWTGWHKEIQVIAIKDQGIDGYFNPKIKVCSKGGENYPEYCYELYSGTSCKIIYGNGTTQASGAGVSAMTFIDWEGNKTSIGAKMGEGLKWKWADGLTDEEKEKFANSPRICACMQKGACMSGASAWGAKAFSGYNIFRPGNMENVCDTCYQTEIKCAPVPLAPVPPPFCEQLAMSPPQVRIVPIADKDNDYFDPKVKVMVDDLVKEGEKIGKELDFPREYGKDKAKEHPIKDKYGTTYDFKTYRKKGQLCAEYLGTQSIDEKNPQFARCFPAPPAPEPKVVKVVNGNTLEIEMKMSENTCTYRAHGTYSNGLCTFNVNASSSTNIGPLSLKVVKPRIVKKTTNSNNNESNIGDVIENIFKNSSRFTILEQYGYVPNIVIELPNGDSCSLTSPSEHNKCKPTKLELDNMGQPKIEVRYMQVRDQANSNSKMLCLSGWQPEPEEFVLERENKIIPLKLMGTRYTKYNAVYSKESNQFYYLPSKEIVYPLKETQERLDKIIFNKQGYVFFPDENEQKKGECSYCVKRNDEIDDTFKSSKGLKVVYKLTDVEHREKCNQGDDGCICFTGTCSRSTRYVDKENTQPFYTKISQNTNGVVTQPEAPIKANRTEVFYADKLCGFDLQSVKEKVLDTIKRRVESQNLPQPYEFSGDNNYTSDLSKYGYIEIEAWGGGEAGHIKDEALSTENRPGMPGDYIKIKLKIDPEYPIIRAKATEGGGGLISHISNKDGGPTWIKICNSRRQNCKPLITVTGGGVHKRYGSQEYKKTEIHGNLGNLKVLGNPTVVEGKKFTGDNQIAYIENGEIKPEAVQCSSASSNKHGAGGCINTNSKIYGRGSPGYVMIRSIKINYEEVKEIIDTLVKNPDSNSVSDLIKELYPDIMKEIKEEIRKELLGL